MVVVTKTQVNKNELSNEKEDNEAKDCTLVYKYKTIFLYTERVYRETGHIARSL